MKVSVVLKRSFGFISYRSAFAMLSATALISCAIQKDSPSDQAASIEPETQVALTTSAVAEPPTVRTLSSLESDALGIELLEDNVSDQLVINANAKAEDFTVNRISDPERVVIDIKGVNSKLNKNFDAGDTSYLTKVRVGSHPDKMRVVVDLPASREIQHSVAADSGKLVVTFSGTESASYTEAAAAGTNETVAALLPVQAEAAEAEADTVVDTISEDQMASPALSTPELSEPEVVAASSEEVEPTSVVKSINIEQIGANGNLIVAEVDEPGVFLLKQTAPSEYVLTLKGAKINSDMTTLVAPPDSGLIRSVRASQDGSDAVLRIFAMPDSKLNARAGDDRIVISAIANQDSFRAQAEAPAAEEVKDEAKPAAGKEEVTLEEDNGDEFEQQLDDLASTQYTGRLISLDLQDTDIDNALRIIAEVSNLNIIASDDVTGKVTLRLIDVPWDQALDVILKTNGLDMVRERNVIRIAPVEKLRQEREALKQLQVSQAELEPLSVKYIRISYAKASELKPLVETVVSERGVVTYDERSNQIIVKDIGAGIRNVSELISRVDLRTPQVLLETQIVEANRTLLRELGAELGFQYIQSAETGNPTGTNFPNSVNIGGSGTPGQGAGLTDGAFSSFPVGGSAISMLLGSADGTKELDVRLSALEQEGRTRVISRPAVATTNNKQATIKSVETIRVRTPQGGLSVATGQGASASGSSTIATEAIEIGIILEVTPQASPDYYVLLDINAKSSTLGSQTVEGIPSEIERSATSTVLVSSGQTFAMGGIYKLTDRDSIEGVPFFKDIPFLGHFFRAARINNGDEELLFFITPRIVEGSFDDATMRFSS